MVRSLLAAVMCAAIVSGCSSSSSTPAGGKRLPGIKEFGLTEPQFVEHVEKVESTIARCMSEAGFEYVPVDVRTVEQAQLYVRSDPDVSREDYHKRWGYGETTRFDNPVHEVGLGPLNRRIYDGLPEADKEAYNRTLFGENPRMTFAFTLDEEDFSETGGCTRKGIAAAFTRQQLLGTYVNPKDVLVESDPRIVDAPSTLTGARAAALKQLQAEEVEASLADLSCEIKYTDDVYREVEIEVFGQPVSG